MTGFTIHFSIGIIDRIQIRRLVAFTFLSLYDLLALGSNGSPPAILFSCFRSLVFSILKTDRHISIAFVLFDIGGIIPGISGSRIGNEYDGSIRFARVVGHIKVFFLQY